MAVLQPPPNAAQLKALDDEVKAWGQITRQTLLRKLAGLGLHERARLLKDGTEYTALKKSIRYNLRKDNDVLIGVALSFARHGIFLERGVGKNRKVGTPAAAKAAKPWIAPTLPSAIQDLAQRLADEYADLAGEELKILIPGVINTKVKIG